MKHTKPELSQKNPYWIDKHRYYELAHFCRQYPIWLTNYSRLNGLIRAGERIGDNPNKNTKSPTEDIAMARVYFSNRIEMLHRTAEKTDPVIGKYILEAVINGFSYHTMNARDRIPCGRDVYYELQRKFFWILNSERQ